MSKKAKSKVVRKAKESKSEIIRRHHDSGYSVKEIKEMTGYSDALVRIVIRNLEKKREKNSAKEGKARFNSPRSRLINDLFQMRKAMDEVEKKAAVEEKPTKLFIQPQHKDPAMKLLAELEAAEKKPQRVMVNLARRKDGAIIDLDKGGEVISPPDLVNKPPHYKTGGVETIDFIEAKDLNYRLGNVVKYVVRCGKKANSDPVQDLEKAAFYLNREIAARKGA